MINTCAFHVDLLKPEWVAVYLLKAYSAHPSSSLFEHLDELYCVVQNESLLDEQANGMSTTMMSERDPAKSFSLLSTSFAITTLP
jgi:hypothetical protein